MSVLHWLQIGRNAETVAFAATLLCLWAAAQAAVMMRARTPRIFTAVALLSLNWAVLLLYYLPGPPQDEILSSLSGILLIYVGILLLREATGKRDDQPVGWLDTVPLHLFRITVAGYGVYLIAKRIFGWEYGLGTLGLALWGTLLAILGYAAVLGAVAYLRHGAPGGRLLTTALTVLVLAYSSCEVAYAVWYARDLWPVYHRYLLLQSRAGAPPLEDPVPVDPQPDWPGSDRWSALERRADWPATRSLLVLQVSPRLPEPWIWLRYALSVCKIVFTGLFLAAVWGASGEERTKPDRGPLAWLGRQMRPRQRGSSAGTKDVPGPRRDPGTAAGS